MNRLSVLAVVAFAVSAVISPAVASEEKPTYTLEIKDHQFTTPELKVKAGEAFKLVVKNNDTSAEEFESDKLKLEKVIAGGKETTFHVRALEAGSYPFVGEFHEDTAKGTIVAE